MDREQSVRYLVEVKYRNGWSKALLDDIRDQVAAFNEIVLVYLNGAPEISGSIQQPSASSYLRCCRLRVNDRSGTYEAYIKPFGSTSHKWLPVAEMNEHPGQWWSLELMQAVFPKLNDRRESSTLLSAIQAIKGILEERDTAPAGYQGAS